MWQLSAVAPKPRNSGMAASALTLKISVTQSAPNDKPGARPCLLYGVERKMEREDKKKKKSVWMGVKNKWQRSLFIYWHSPRWGRRHAIRQRAEIAAKPDKKNKISQANCLLCISVPAVLAA